MPNWIYIHVLLIYEVLRVTEKPRRSKLNLKCIGSIERYFFLIHFIINSLFQPVVTRKWRVYTYWGSYKLRLGILEEIAIS